MWPCGNLLLGSPQLSLKAQEGLGDEALRHTERLLWPLQFGTLGYDNYREFS